MKLDGKLSESKTVAWFGFELMGSFVVLFSFNF
jgi:hypothetical protein